MIKLVLKMSICTTFLLRSVMGMESQGSELSDIVETAMRTSTLAAKALNQEKSFREKTIQELNEFRESVKEIGEREDPKKWQQRILAQIQKDEETTKALDEALKPFQSGVTVRYSVKTHKTGFILEGTKRLVTESFFDLLNDEMPAGYVYDQQTVTILGGDNTKTIWGNSRGTYLKTVYLYMLSNQEEGVSKSFGSRGLSWFDSSASVHVAPLPDEIVLDLSSYSFISPYKPGVSRGLVLPHSGYAFGGLRSEARYPNGKQYGPHDCSSWLGSLTGGVVYTTADQLCAYRKLLKQGGFIPDNWEKGLDARYLLENMDVVTVKDPSQDIQPGQIFASRRFAETDPQMTTLGVGGHTAITLGYLRDGHVVTIGYNRDMPTLEGFGIQNFSWAPEPLKMKMLFNVKGM